ncbi:MAG: glycoside hydrolase family 92 protein [bacterium]|nr:glycoside hydrolase family 92 protein [bacterium]
MTGKRPADLANLFIGTAGDHGQLYPGAEMPFGFVKLGPDTYPGALSGSAHAGYDYNDSRIMGFSHLRFSGVGNLGVGGNILLLPATGKDVFDPELYSASFDKASEHASPGLYGVTLGAAPIDASITATNHVGFHRYGFPDAPTPHVLMDFSRGYTPVRDVHCLPTSDRELVGELTSNQMSTDGWYRVFFCIQFDTPFVSLNSRPRDRRGRRMFYDDPKGQLAVAAHLGADTRQVQVKVALSSLSVADARRNIEAEAPEWDFDAVHSRCRAAWDEVLNRVEVSGGDEENRILLHSLLYRACLSPFHNTTVDDTYMGDDGEIHTTDDHTHYNGWSIWDTYRTKFPLLALFEPARTRDFMESLVNTLVQRRGRGPADVYYDYAGYAPLPTVRFELANAVLLDAHVKGVGPKDPGRMYDVVADLADMDFPPADDALGYVPRRPDVTFQNAYDNWTAAELARALDKDKDVERFERRAQFYRNVWDPSIRFPRARDEEGNWLDFPEDPTVVEEKYVYEGSMWHWRWGVVHDVKGLIELMGGPDQFIKDLTYFLENDLHNHGNEPGIHAAWMFAAAGAPWLSQEWVRRIMTEPLTQYYGTHGFLPEPYRGRIYKNTPDGMIEEMDDDDGCMAAWFVFSSMGLFPLCPGRPFYAVGVPLFEKVAFHHQEGEDFRIECLGFAPDAWYIQAAQLNGKPFDRPWIRHDEIVAGGVLEMEVGPEPNPSWGVSDEAPW